MTETGLPKEYPFTIKMKEGGHAFCVRGSMSPRVMGVWDLFN